MLTLLLKKNSSLLIWIENPLCHSILNQISHGKEVQEMRLAKAHRTPGLSGRKVVTCLTPGIRWVCRTDRSWSTSPSPQPRNVHVSWSFRLMSLLLTALPQRKQAQCRYHFGVSMSMCIPPFHLLQRCFPVCGHVLILVRKRTSELSGGGQTSLGYKQWTDVLQLTWSKRN